MFVVRSPAAHSLLRDRSLMAVVLAVAVSFVGIGMVLPVRVLYAESKGASLAIIGAMASSFLLSNFLFQYPTGWIADLWGRKQTMIAGLVAQSLISLSYLLVTDPVLFVVIRFLEGIFAASVIPSARALVSEMAPRERQGEAYGVFGSFMNAGFLVGPALGGLFASLGFTSAFVGSFVFRLIALGLVVMLVPARATVHPEHRERARSLPRRALFTLPLLGAYLLTFGDNIYFGFDLTLMPLWMRNHLGASVTLIGLAYAVWALPSMFMSPYGGRVADRRRRSAVILIFGLAQVPMYVAYGLITALAPLLVLFVVHAIAFSMVQPSVDASLAAAAPAGARARAQGVYSAAGLASAFISANVLSGLYGVNFRLPLFAMGAGFALCVLGGAALLRAGENRASSAPSRQPLVAAD